MRDLSLRAPASLPVAEGATVPVPGAGNPIIWSTTANKHLYWDGAKWQALIPTTLPLSLLAQGGANIGDSIVWDGTKWAAGTPLPGSWADAYAFLMDTGNNAAGLETFVGTTDGYFSFTALLARAEWSTVVSTPTALAMALGSSTAMTAVAASSTAFATVLDNLTARASMLGSSTAMTAVAASSTAMGTVKASSATMAAVCNSAVALAAISDSPSAWTSFTSSTALTVAAIPTMTSNTAPSGTAAASSVNGSNNAAWKAMDKNETGTGWVTGYGASDSQWVSYDFTAPRFIHTALISSRYVYNATSRIKNFRVEYSDNNGTWTTALSGTKADAATTETFNIVSAGAHRYWRLYAVDNRGYTSVDVSEFNVTGFVLP